MATPWTLVSPASRGIGFQFARRLLETTTVPVVATARKNQDQVKSKLLEGLDVDGKRLDVLPLDVTDESTIASAASFCQDKFSSSYLHLALILPGILHPEKSPSQISGPSALSTLQINLLGPLLLSKHFTPFLPRRSTTLSNPASLSSSNSSPSLPLNPTFALMAARVGSTSDNRLGGWYSYRASKAGVISLARSLNNYLAMSSGGKAVSVALHPGTVKTGLSEEFWGSTPKEKLFEPEFAVERLLDVVARLEKDQGGRCWDWKGEEILP